MWHRVASMDTKLLLHLFYFYSLLGLLLFLLPSAHGQAIANFYTTTNASRMILAPGEPYVTKTFFPGNNYTTFEGYPNYCFDGNSTGWVGGQVNVPNRYVIPLPWCAIPNMRVANLLPPGCQVRLLWGKTRIGPVPNESYIVNGDADNLIVGAIVPRVDAGYPQTAQGTVEVEFLPGCPTVDGSFLLQLEVGIMSDFADAAPVAVRDSCTNQTLHTVIAGFGCGWAPRPPGSPPLNPMPVFIPICRGVMPYNTSINDTVYTQLFGGRIGPSNIPLGSIVYQLRFDGLGHDLQVWTHVQFKYPDNTQEDQIIYPGFNNIYYVHSKGSVPAIVSMCWGEEACVPQFAWNEVQLGYLSDCNCQTPNNNVMCSNTTEVEGGPLNRSSIPNFNAAIPFISNPSCVFAVNPAGNLTAPIRNKPFQLQSLATGGVGPLSYAWQLWGLPPSGGGISMPTNAQTVTATVSSLGPLTIVHTVFTPSGVPQTCNQTVDVIAGGPVPCVIPNQLNNLIVGFPIGIDASCTTSPDGSPLYFNWFLVASPYPYNGGTLTPNTGPSIGFTCTIPGLYIISIIIANAAQNTSAQSIITCIPPPPIPPPSGGPAVGTPITCIGETPLANTTLPPIANGVIPPLDNVPIPPGTPPPGSIIPAEEPPWLIPGVGPLTSASLANIMFACILLVALLIIFMLIKLCDAFSYCARLQRHHRRLDNVAKVM